MPQETRKIWARTGTAKGLSRAVEAMDFAAGSSSALPATFRRRLQRLTEQIAKLHEDIRNWPATQDERLLKERTGTFYGKERTGIDEQYRRCISDHINRRIDRGTGVHE